MQICNARRFTNCLHAGYAGSTTCIRLLIYGVTINSNHLLYPLPHLDYNLSLRSE